MRGGAEAWKGVAMRGKAKMRGGTASHMSAREKNSMAMQENYKKLQGE